MSDAPIRPPSLPLPLITTDWESIEEVTKNFATLFESRYGKNRGHVVVVPKFHIGSLESAIARSSEAPNKPGRPLALYIHHDSSIARNVFPAGVLCNDSVAHLLQSEFVLWAWDATTDKNHDKLVDWLNEYSLLQAVSKSSSLPSIDSFPLLILITVERGQLKMIDRVYGGEGPQEAASKMYACLDAYTAAREEEAKMSALYEEQETKKKELYEKYIRLKEYVRGAEAYANKPPALQGSTVREYIKSQQDDIKIINLFVSMGIRADTEDARAEVASCHASIVRVEQQLEDGELMESELYKVHRTEEEDRECKEYLKGHVEIKKKVLDDMRVQLLLLN